MALQFTKEQVDTLLESVSGVVSKRENRDSSYRGFGYISLAWKDIQSVFKNFNYNFGQLSDGREYRLHSYDQYFLLTTDISVWCKRDVLGKVESLQSRSIEEKPTFTIYCNGSKIPDAKVYIYPMESGTDFLIPKSVLSENAQNNFFFERRYYNKHSYLNKYFEKFNGTVLNCEFTDYELDGLTIDKTKVMVFGHNGDLINSEGYKVELIGNSVQIIFPTLVNNENIEVFIDPSIQYKKEANQDISSKAFFSIDESYIDPIYGPSNEESCLFFVDGKRLHNNIITQVGLLHWEAPLGVNRNCKTTIFFTDRVVGNNKLVKRYTPDYYVYNMFGTSGVSKILRGEVPEFFEDIDFNNLLSVNGTRFTDATVNEIVETFNNSQTYEDKVRYILGRAPYTLRNFLESYKKRSKAYSVSYNGTDEYVYIGTGDTVSVNEAITYDVVVNGKHVPNYNIVKRRKSDTEYIGIIGTSFKQGVNVIELTTYTNKHRPFLYQTITKDSMTFVNGAFVLSINTPEGVRNTNDIIVLKKIENIDGYMYAFEDDNQPKVGYIPLPNVHYQVEANGYTHISIPEAEMLNTDSVIIYSKKFSTVFSTEINNTYENGDSLDEFVIPITMGHRQDPIPMINSGMIKVYADNTPLQEGMDYFYRTPEDFESLSYTGLIIKNRYPDGTKIDIYFTGIQNKTILSLENEISNPYGLLYVDTPFPFSMKYMNIYVGGVKLLQGDVDIISDHLIRIPKKSVPFDNLVIQSAFSEDWDMIEPYFRNYTKTDLDQKLMVLFDAYNYTRIKGIDEEIFDPLPVWNTFVKDVDSVQKALNADNGDIVSEDRIDLYVYAYLKWLMTSSEVKVDPTEHEEILPEIIKKFELFLNNMDTEDRDIVVDMGLFNLLEDMSNYDQNYLETEAQRVEYMANWLKQYGGDSYHWMDRYIDDYSGNVLYEDDLVSLGSEVHFEDTNEDIVLGDDEFQVINNDETERIYFTAEISQEKPSIKFSKMNKNGDSFVKDWEFDNSFYVENGLHIAYKPIKADQILYDNSDLIFLDRNYMPHIYGTTMNNELSLMSFDGIKINNEMTIFKNDNYSTYIDFANYTTRNNIFISDINKNGDYLFRMFLSEDNDRILNKLHDQHIEFDYSKINQSYISGNNIYQRGYKYFLFNRDNKTIKDINLDHSKHLQLFNDTQSLGTGFDIAFLNFYKKGFLLNGTDCNETDSTTPNVYSKYGELMNRCKFVKDVDVYKDDFVLKNNINSQDNYIGFYDMYESDNGDICYIEKRDQNNVLCVVTPNLCLKEYTLFDDDKYSQLKVCDIIYKIVNKDQILFFATNGDTENSPVLALYDCKKEKLTYSDENDIFDNIKTKFPLAKHAEICSIHTDRGNDNIIIQVKISENDTVINEHQEYEYKIFMYCKYDNNQFSFDIYGKFSLNTIAFSFKDIPTVKRRISDWNDCAFTIHDSIPKTSPLPHLTNCSTVSILNLDENGIKDFIPNILKLEYGGEYDENVKYCKISKIDNNRIIVFGRRNYTIIDKNDIYNHTWISYNSKIQNNNGLYCIDSVYFNGYVLVLLSDKKIYCYSDGGFTQLELTPSDENITSITYHDGNFIITTDTALFNHSIYIYDILFKLVETRHVNKTVKLYNYNDDTKLSNGTTIYIEKAFLINDQLIISLKSGTSSTMNNPFVVLNENELRMYSNMTNRILYNSDQFSRDYFVDNDYISSYNNFNFFKGVLYTTLNDGIGSNQNNRFQMFALNKKHSVITDTRASSEFIIESKNIKVSNRVVISSNYLKLIGIIRMNDDNKYIIDNNKNLKFFKVNDSLVEADMKDNEIILKDDIIRGCGNSYIYPDNTVLTDFKIHAGRIMAPRYAFPNKNSDAIIKEFNDSYKQLFKLKDEIYLVLWYDGYSTIHAGLIDICNPENLISNAITIPRCHHYGLNITINVLLGGKIVFMDSGHIININLDNFNISATPLDPINLGLDDMYYFVDSPIFSDIQNETDLSNDSILIRARKNSSIDPVDFEFVKMIFNEDGVSSFEMIEELHEYASMPGLTYNDKNTVYSTIMNNRTPPQLSDVILPLPEFSYDSRTSKYYIRNKYYYWETKQCIYNKIDAPNYISFYNGERVEFDIKNNSIVKAPINQTGGVVIDVIDDGENLIFISLHRITDKKIGFVISYINDEHTTPIIWKTINDIPCSNFYGGDTNNVPSQSLIHKILKNKFIIDLKNNTFLFKGLGVARNYYGLHISPFLIRNDKFLSVNGYSNEYSPLQFIDNLKILISYEFIGDLTCIDSHIIDANLNIITYALVMGKWSTDAVSSYISEDFILIVDYNFLENKIEKYGELISVGDHKRGSLNLIRFVNSTVFYTNGLREIHLTVISQVSGGISYNLGTDIYCLAFKEEFNSFKLFNNVFDDNVIRTGALLMPTTTDVIKTDNLIIRMISTCHVTNGLMLYECDYKLVVVELNSNLDEYEKTIVHMSKKLDINNELYFTFLNLNMRYIDDDISKDKIIIRKFKNYNVFYNDGLFLIDKNNYNKHEIVNVPQYYHNMPITFRDSHYSRIRDNYYRFNQRVLDKNFIYYNDKILTMCRNIGGATKFPIVEISDGKFYILRLCNKTGINYSIKGKGNTRYDYNLGYGVYSHMLSPLFYQDYKLVEKEPEYITPAGSIIVSTDHGLFFSVDSGITWFLQGVSQYGLMNKSVNSADIKWQSIDVHEDPALVGKPYGVIALSTDRGVFYSNDGGQTWLRDASGIMNNTTNIDI